MKDFSDAHSIVAIFEQVADKLKDRCAIQVPSRSVFGRKLKYREWTFGELKHQVERIAWSLNSKGMRKGDRVLVALKPGFDLVAIVYAMFKIGAIPVIIDSGLPRAMLLRCIAQSKPLWAISDWRFKWVKRVYSKSLQTVEHVLVVQDLLSIASTCPIGSDKHQTNVSFIKEDVAAIVFTSGSTGDPKGVVYQHQHFLAQLAQLKGFYGIQPCEVDLPLLPIFALFDPCLGMTLVFPELDYRKPAQLKPKRIVQAILNCQVTNAFGAPVLWRKILDFCVQKNLRLPSMQRLLIAGSSVPIQLVMDLKKICPNADIHTPYGATEALPIASNSDPYLLSDLVRKKSLSGAGTCVGKPLPGVLIRILPCIDGMIEHVSHVDCLATHQIGEIAVTGGMVTECYDGLEDKTALAKIRDLDGRIWHRMGDLGYFDADGLLWFCGRKVERVEAPSGLFYTDCCENIFNQHAKVERSALIALRISAKLSIPAVVIQPKEKINLHQERYHLMHELKRFAKAFEATRSIETFFIQEQFPVDVRHNAKIHRLKLSRQYSHVFLKGLR